MNLTKWRPGNTKEVPSKSAVVSQGSGVATYTPESQVIHKGQRLRRQKKQKLKVSDHTTSKNKNTMNRCSSIRVMHHTLIKITRITVNATNKPRRISIGSYQTVTTPQKRKRIEIS